MTEVAAQSIYASPVVIPLDRPPFDLPGKKNGMYVTIGTPSGLHHQVQVDTGSTGLVLPVQYLWKDSQDESQGLADGVVCLGEASITYHPLGDSQYGCYYYVPRIAIGRTSREGDPVTYACEAGPLIVYGIRCTTAATGKPMVPVDLSVGMMGVGFGRAPKGMTNPDGQVYWPSNPFLYASKGTQPLYPAYLLSSRAGEGGGYITLGVGGEQFTAAPLNGTLVDLTPATPAPVPTAPFPNTPGSTCSCRCTPPQGGWPAPPPERRYFETAAATIAISTLNNGQPMPATILMDTGVTGMMMSVAGIDTWQDQIGNATITISVPGAGGTAMSYSFSLGPATAPGSYPVEQSSSPAAPTDFAPIEASGQGFVNTGINVLREFDYYFDGLQGKIGFARIRP